MEPTQHRNRLYPAHKPDLNITFRLLRLEGSVETVQRTSSLDPRKSQEWSEAFVPRRRISPPAPSINRNRLTDRDLLPSQRYRNGFLELPPAVTKCSASSLEPLKPPCVECRQAEHINNQRSLAAHICRTCHHFVPLPTVTALTLPPSPLPSLMISPRLPTPPSPSTKCPTCFVVPPLYYAEAQTFLTLCSLCGHMTEETLLALIKYEGDVHSLILFSSPTSLSSSQCQTQNRWRWQYRHTHNPSCTPSKALRDWCFYIASTGRAVGSVLSTDVTVTAQNKGNVNPNDTLANKIAAYHPRFNRRRATARKPLRTTISFSRHLQRPRRDGVGEGLESNLVEEHSLAETETGAKYSRRFSFDEASAHVEGLLMARPGAVHQPCHEQHVRREGEVVVPSFSPLSSSSALDSEAKTVEAAVPCSPVRKGLVVGERDGACDALRIGRERRTPCTTFEQMGL